MIIIFYIFYFFIVAIFMQKSFMKTYQLEILQIYLEFLPTWYFYIYFFLSIWMLVYYKQKYKIFLNIDCAVA